jgi:hypothetical protein
MWTTFIRGLWYCVNFVVERVIFQGYLLWLSFWVRFLRWSDWFRTKHICCMIILFSHSYCSRGVIQFFHHLSNFILFLYIVPFVREINFSFLNFIDSEIVSVPFALRDYELNQFLWVLWILSGELRSSCLLIFGIFFTLFDFFLN